MFGTTASLSSPALRKLARIDRKREDGVERPSEATMTVFTGNVSFGPAEVGVPLSFNTAERGPLPLNHALLNHLEDGSWGLPADHFQWQARVPDEVVFTFGDDGEAIVPQHWLLLNDDIPDWVHGCVVFVLESPYRAEYTLVMGAWTPLRPLNDNNARHHFLMHAPLIIGNLAHVPVGTAVVLSNPVPYQTSMDRVMARPGGRNRPLRLQRPVRNAIWKRLFDPELGGVVGFRADFQQRVLAYQPIAIVNACTSELKAHVGAALDEIHGWAHAPLRFRCWHPSTWSLNAPVLTAGW